MSRKQIAIKEPTVLELQFMDGTTVEAAFTMKALRIITEEFGGLMKVFSETNGDIYSLGTKLLYAAMKAMDDSITFDQALNIIEVTGIGDVTQVIELATEGLSNKNENEALKKTLMEKMLKK